MYISFCVHSYSPLECFQTIFLFYYFRFVLLQFNRYYFDIVVSVSYCCSLLSICHVLSVNISHGGPHLCSTAHNRMQNNTCEIVCAKKEMYVCYVVNFTAFLFLFLFWSLLFFFSDVVMLFCVSIRLRDLFFLCTNVKITRQNNYLLSRRLTTTNEFWTCIDFS